MFEMNQLMVVLILFCGKCKLEKKTRTIRKEEQASTKLVDGMRGVMSEGGLEDAKAHASEC